MSLEKKHELIQFFIERIKKAISSPIKEKDWKEKRAEGYVTERGYTCPPYRVETSDPIEYQILLQTINDQFGLPEGWVEESYEHELDHYTETAEQYSDPSYKLRNLLGVTFIDRGKGIIGIQPVHNRIVEIIDDEETRNKKGTAITNRPRKLSKGDLLDNGDLRANDMNEEDWV